MCLEKLKSCGAWISVVLRVVVGILFFMHGTQKLFGWFGGQQTYGLDQLLGWAGLIEVVVGLAVTLGFFTRSAALLGSAEMAAALFIAHFPKGLNILANGGERAVLFLVAFLVIATTGPVRFSLEKKLLRKERF